MSEWNIETELKKVVQESAVKIAAEDRFLRGVSEYILLGTTALVSEQLVNDLEPKTLYQDIAEHYGLTEQEVQQAIEMCEDSVLEDAAYG